LSLASEGGFSGAVSLTCTGAPNTTTCSLTPSSVTLAASGTTAFTVRVNTTARSMAPPCSRLRLPGVVALRTLLLIALVITVAVLGRMRPGLARSKRGLWWAALGATLLFVALSTGCGQGGGTSGPPPVTGTQAGTYPFTVSASASGLTKNVSLTLFVN
jgi:hypothetical protein